MTKAAMIKADLHLHTTASDGRLSPDQLVALAVKQGLNVIAVTDHDTVNGIGTALKAAQKLGNISVIPGVEINTDVPGTEVHMLGYFIDFENGRLLSTLEELRNSRETRALQMIQKLERLGMPIQWQKIKELAKDSSIGRPHIAMAMIEAGYIRNFDEAFEKYIGRNGPAYVEHKKISPIEAIQLIKTVHGIPVLAHPGFVLDVETKLVGFKQAGLMGLEIYYSSYTKDVIDGLTKMAQKFDLIPTGGTDYHAIHDEKETYIGNALAPADSVRRLYALAGELNPQLMKKYALSLKEYSL